MRYFAYGSNMGLQQMKKRCPQHKVVGQGILRGYRWIINSRGYANVITSESDHVLGVVYELSAADENTLDKKEGVALGRYRKETLNIVIGDDQIPCLVYIDPIDKEGLPGEEYIRRIEDGIIDAKLPADYVAMYMKPYLKHLHESDNVFLDLGYSSEDAEILRLRADLMAVVRKWISDKGFSLAEAAKTMQVSEARISDLVRGKCEKFSLETLVVLAIRSGFTLTLNKAA